MLLIDSGGQYVAGTTDITRTIAVGAVPEEQKRFFTLVLKGMIAISLLRFPEGTRGVDIDPFARIALWKAGADFAHGTGHGVGSYLSVHEGPQSISRRGMQELLPGMILSNEPATTATAPSASALKTWWLCTSRRRSKAATSRCSALTP
jgi:Xaa-Pro aminopeptidase